MFSQQLKRVTMRTNLPESLLFYKENCKNLHKCYFVMDENHERDYCFQKWVLVLSRSYCCGIFHQRATWALHVEPPRHIQSSNFDHSRQLMGILKLRCTNNITNRLYSGDFLQPSSDSNSVGNRLDRDKPAWLPLGFVKVPRDGLTVLTVQ